MIDVFKGTLMQGVPFEFWHRVLPDFTAVDLPPVFQVREIEEEEEAKSMTELPTHNEILDARDALSGETHPDVAVVKPLDFTSADALEFAVSADGRRAWVHVDGVTVLRVYRIGSLTVQMPAKLRGRVQPTPFENWTILELVDNIIRTTLHGPDKDGGEAAVTEMRDEIARRLDEDED